MNLDTPLDWDTISAINTYLMSYGSQRNRLSACAAEFLAVDPYLNPDIPLEAGAAPTVELMSPKAYSTGSESVPIRLKISDADGIHQVLVGSDDLITCHGLKGKKEAILEFEYEGFASQRGYISLSDDVSHSIVIKAVDINGDVGRMSFQLAEVLKHRIHTLEGHTRGVTSLAFSPDGKKIVSGSPWGAVKLWDVSTHRNIATFETIAPVAFSPDGTILVTGRGLWDVATQRNIATFAKSGGCLALSPDGKMLVLGAYDGTITLWDVATKRDIFTFEAHTGYVDSVAFSPDGKMFASGARNGMIKLWDAATRDNIASIEDILWSQWPGDISVAFSPDGTILASGTTSGSGMRWWDVATKRNIAFSKHIILGDSLAFSPDGEIIASSYVEKVTLRDVTTGAHIADLPHTSHVWSVAFSPDGKTLGVRVHPMEWSNYGI